MISFAENGSIYEVENKIWECFGFSAGVWHSGLTPKKKKIIWSGISSGKINVIIGARSSLFLPFKKLGIIIVDESTTTHSNRMRGYCIRQETWKLLEIILKISLLILSILSLTLKHMQISRNKNNHGTL